MPTDKLAEPDMPKRFRSWSALQTALCASVVVLCAFSVLGQSGRRGRKPAPPIVPAPEATPTPISTAQKTKPALTLVVGVDKYGDRIPIATSTAVLRSCANRLDEPEAVEVEMVSQDMSRGDAVNRAKSQKEAYVVWLNLRPDTLSGRAESNDPYNIYIEYSVFAPTTAKEVRSGRVFPGAYGKKGVIVKPGAPGVYSDYYLIRAAREAADKILGHFHVRPSGRLP